MKTVHIFTVLASIHAHISQHTVQSQIVTSNIWRKPSLIYGYSLTNPNYYITWPDNRFLQTSNYQNCLSDRFDQI